MNHGFQNFLLKKRKQNKTKLEKQAFVSRLAYSDVFKAKAGSDTISQDFNSFD